MSGLNTNYIPLSTIQEVFFDKVSDAPLAGGVVTFYQDNARTTPKNVYTLSGSPPDYTYTTLGNVLTLSSIGTFNDSNGNNLVPYLYPYDANGNVQLYYITVYNSAGTFQFSVGGVPNVEESSVSEQSSNIINFIPNGQFLLNNVTANSGAITQLVTPIAYGGWQFVRQTNLSTDYVTFPQFGSAIDNPTGNPRFALNLSCQIFNTGDTSKMYQCVFSDVNRFSSNTQYLNLFFSGQSNTLANIPINITLYKNFGTGGSAPQTIQIGQVTFSQTYQNFNVAFIFGDNSGNNVGANNDDYFAIQFNVPATSTFNITTTDIALTLSETPLANYPIITNCQTVGQSLGSAFPIPVSDGSELGLPAVLSLNGWVYDDTQVGRICEVLYPTAGFNEVLCDGTSYDPTTRNAFGIPYSRVATKLTNATTGMSLFGTGKDFVTAIQCDQALSTVIVSTNSSVTPPNAITDGLIPTGFEFTQISVGNTLYGFDSYIDSFGSITVINKEHGPSFPVPDGLTYEGTSGFSISKIFDGADLSNSIVKIIIATIDSLAGKYFIITNDHESFYVWFTVDGVGADPRPTNGGIGIKVALLSWHTYIDARNIIKNTIAGFAVNSINHLPARMMTADSYFIFNNSNNDLYYVWYRINDIGTDPVISGAKKGFMISLNGDESEIETARATQLTLASAMWGAPDFRGAFLRAWTSTSTNNYDPDVASRVAYWNGNAGNNIGSLQYTQNLSHQHNYNTYDSIKNQSGSSTGCWTGTNAVQTSLTGGNQSNPVNIYVNYVIKI